VHPQGWSLTSGAGKAESYHGYYFRVLKSPGPEAAGGALDYLVNDKMIGGFALVARPAESAANRFGVMEDSWATRR
jgi:hypothetical protein